jgi:glucose-fructose oxidoreductase
LGFPERNIYNYGTMARLATIPTSTSSTSSRRTALHPEHVIAAAWAGKHVISEKPMANTVADCDAMLTACRLRGREALVGYRLQFEPHYRRVQAPRARRRLRRSGG